MKWGATVHKSFKKIFFYSLADKFNRVRKVADDLVLLLVHVLAFGVNPAAALGALDHPGVVVVVVVTGLTERTKASLLLLQTTGGTERLRVIRHFVLGKVRDVRLVTRVTTETSLATLSKTNFFIFLNRPL